MVSSVRRKVTAHEKQNGKRSNKKAPAALTFLAGEAGLEPTVVGFGDRRSTS